MTRPSESSGASKRVALKGGTDAELAERLGMSTGTVRSHLGHLRAKLGVHSSKDLVAAF
jgi:DNA-binding CsgD family transcriptional regulator